ncbi:WD40 repeat-like protein [Meredithblackwellia eburnea MCA 4105]
MENTPQMSWFAGPEGVYTLAQSINITHLATAHLPSQGIPPTTPQISSTNQQSADNHNSTTLPPPLNTTKIAAVAVKFPIRDTAQQQSGLGLNMNLNINRTTNNNINIRTREPSTTDILSSQAQTAPQPSPSSIQPLGQDGLPSFNSSNLIGASASATTSATIQQSSTVTSPTADSLGASLSSPPLQPSHPALSPTQRRKPLSSSFSIPTLVSLGNQQQQQSLSDTIITSRPTRPFRGTSSSFVRAWEGLPLSQPQLRGLADANAGKQSIFAFYTTGKSVVWVELGQGRPKEALCRVTFSIAPTCIDVNQHTASPSQLDVLVGFANGDIFWFDPISAKYTRLNKSGIITSSAITSCRWLPPAPSFSANENIANLFLTSHADGSVVVWDKDREDWNGFAPTPVPSPVPVPVPDLGAGKENSWNGGSGSGNLSVNGDNNTGSLGGNSSSSIVNEEKHAPVGGGRQAAAMGVGPKGIVVSKPAAVDKKGQSTAKFNPVSHWKISNKPITAFTFSPGLEYVATVGEDGCLRIIDAAAEKLLDTFAGYFGALTCVDWSPDGRFVATGGQDDLCTIYAPLEQRLVARCQGHSSWVTGVAWDAWRGDERTSRFASVGEDCKVILWDLSSAALSRPKSHAAPTNRRMSVGSTFSLARRRAGESTAHLVQSPAERSDPVYHPAPRRSEVSMLQPIMVKTLSNDLFSNVLVFPGSLLTVSRAGQIKLWERPPTNEDGEPLGLFALRNEYTEARER